MEPHRLLRFNAQYELDGFLKAYELWADYTIDDLRREIQNLESLGL